MSVLNLKDFAQAVMVFAINAERDPVERAAKIEMALNANAITQDIAEVLRWK